jgi:hypothetical protein
MQLLSAATFNNGIVKFSEKNFQKSRFFDQEKSSSNY